MALSHIVMHVALCNSTAAQAASRDVPVRVVLTDKLDRVAFDQKFKIEQGTKREAPIEFDMPFGLYLVKIATPTCSGVQFLSVLADVNRGFPISLQEGRAQMPESAPAFVEGTAPFEFSYVQPLVMVFPHSVKCDGPIGDPIDANIQMDNEPNSYYATIYPSRVLEQNAPVTLVVRMNDSHGGYQYLRVPIGDNVGTPTRWPSIGQLNISAGLIDALASKPEDTLLCVRMMKTTVNG